MFLLQSSHLQRKSRSEFLQPGLCPDLAIFLINHSPFLKDIPIIPHEYEITLVVKCCHLLSLKLRIVWEQASQESSGTISQPRGESVQIELGNVTRCRSVVGHVRGRYHVGHLEEGMGPLRPLAAADGRRCNISMPLHILLFSDSTVKCVNFRLLPKAQISFTE